MRISFEDWINEYAPITEKTDFDRMLREIGNYEPVWKYTRHDLLKAVWHIVPDNKKYELFEFDYTTSKQTGDIWYANMIINDIRRLRPQSVLDALLPYTDANGYIAVYRGTSSCRNQEYSFSWSVSKDVADFFAYRHNLFRGGKKSYVSTGRIKVDDVAMFIKEPEFEIIQFGQVKDIHSKVFKEELFNVAECRHRLGWREGA